jgi:hypothetical protein
VQRRFNKRFPGLAKNNYSSRLALLDLDSLELGRLRQDLILVYKIVFRLVDVNRVCSFSSYIFTIGGASALVAQEVVCTALFTRSLVRL